MQNRHQEMQNFIVYLSSIYQNNEDFKFSFEELYFLIYNQLVRIGVEEDNDVDFSNEGNHTFDRLVSYFSDRRNINTYIDPVNNYFLQLQNKPELHANNVETIKIYLPQDALNLERSAKTLFDFLDDSNIPHISKISKHERFDDIVVQVTNMMDANRILNFAKGNRQIQAGLLPPNPFCFSTDDIAIAFGRNGQTVNTVVASLLAAYSMKKIVTKTTDDMFLLDFIYFCNQYYDKHFEKLEDIGEVVADFNIVNGEANTSENNKKIANVGNIMRFFLDSIYPMYGLDNFNKDFLDTSNDAKLIGKANEIGVRRYDKPNPLDKQFVGTIDNILLDSVDTFKNKYHIDDDRALVIVKTYLEDGNESKITRDNDTRNKYIKSEFASKMKKLLELSKKDLKTYYLEKKKARAIDSLESAIMETYLKYEDRYEQGFEQVDGVDRAIYALKRLVMTDETDGFTRNNNARANLIKYKDYDLMFEGIIDRNKVYPDVELSDICRAYVTKVIENKNMNEEYSNSK